MLHDALALLDLTSNAVAGYEDFLPHNLDKNAPGEHVVQSLKYNFKPNINRTTHLIIHRAYAMAYRVSTWLIRIGPSKCCLKYPRVSSDSYPPMFRVPLGLSY